MINWEDLKLISSPWKHYTFDSMFQDIEEITNLSKSLLPEDAEIAANPIKYNTKRIVNKIADNNHSCEVDITEHITSKHSSAKKLVDYFSKDGKTHLEKIGCLNFSSPLFLRIQFVRDIDGYYIEPHTDKINKLVTIICHLNSVANGGTQILDKNRSIVKRVNSEKNNALLFFPNYAPYVKTYHAFVDSPIIGNRDILMINYYNSTDVTTEHIWSLV